MSDQKGIGIKHTLCDVSRARQKLTGFFKTISSLCTSLVHTLLFSVGQVIEISGSTFGTGTNGTGRPLPRKYENGAREVRTVYFPIWKCSNLGRIFLVV